MKDSLRRVILYACPKGEFAHACGEYWREVTDLNLRTSAQYYPPHVSLTGFFWRSPNRCDELADSLAVLLVDDYQRHWEPTIRPVQQAGWLGFTLRCGEWEEVASRLAQAAPTGVEGEDEVRVKQDLHLSLAYGAGFNAERHVPIAQQLFHEVDRTETAWDIVLLEDEGGRFRRFDAAAGNKNG